ncbi:hypothetical protein JW721_04485 [Candidatus Micrarchaeota archaeon]|nr:hypothetical protein [Candidatus Micrarchaeota archaeon]
MAGNKAEKAKEELRWNEARSFAKGLEAWAETNKAQKAFRKCFVETLGTTACRKIRAQYKMANKGERMLFLKCAMRFVYAAGGGKEACSSLASIIFEMAEGGARMGELYEYVLQNQEKELEHGRGRLAKILVEMDKEGIGKEYYQWFAGEFGSDEKKAPGRGPIPISISSAKELLSSRMAVNMGALEARIHAPKGRLAGSAAMGRIREYLETGKLTKLTFRDKAASESVARILFDSGVVDILPSGNHVTLGLREKIYEAKAAARRGVAAVPAEEYLEYFLGKGLEESKAMEIARLMDSGRESEALGEMCRFALKECRNQYVYMGERKRSFGKKGAEMLASFKKHAGGNVSLMGVYGMMERGEFSPALRRLRELFGAIERVSEEYPAMFIGF